jgi:hypothetical protein
LKLDSKVCRLCITHYNFFPAEFISEFLKGVWNQLLALLSKLEDPDFAVIHDFWFIKLFVPRSIVNLSNSPVPVA